MTQKWLKNDFSGPRGKWLKNDSNFDSFPEKSHSWSHFWVTFPGPWNVIFESPKMSFLGPGSVAPRRFKTSSSIFDRIIRAGIGVFWLWGLTKVMFVSNISDTTTPSLPPTPLEENTEIATLYDTIWHYFARFRLKTCYCSWPPNIVREPVVCTPDSCRFRHCRGFRDWCQSSTPLLVRSCLSCLHRFRRSRDFSRFGERRRTYKPLL